jgi:hypothetical protein
LRIVHRTRRSPPHDDHGCASRWLSTSQPPYSDSPVGLRRPLPSGSASSHVADRCARPLFAPTIRVSDRVRPAPDGVHQGIPVPVRNHLVGEQHIVYRPLGELAPRVPRPRRTRRGAAPPTLPRSAPAPWRGVLVGRGASRRSARRSRPAITAQSWAGETPAQLTPDDDWTLTEVWGVNDAGQIGGSDAHRIDGIYQRAFLLTPHRHRRPPRPARGTHAQPRLWAPKCRSGVPDALRRPSFGVRLRCLVVRAGVTPCRTRVATVPLIDGDRTRSGMMRWLRHSTGGW